MAEGKKAFVLYCDLIHTVKRLTKEQAGDLFVHILEYVNDMNPTPNSIITELTFEPVKQQLKRDLKRYEEKQIQRIEAGKRSAELRKAKEIQQPPTTVESRSTKSTVIGTVIGTGIVTVKGTVTDTVIESSNEDKEERDINNISLNGGEWKKDFQVYLNGLRLAYREILKDEDWIKKQQGYYPKIDIQSSLLKSCENFWATEGGWKNKKNARIKEINWKLTFANALSQKINHVYGNTEISNGDSKTAVGNYQDKQNTDRTSTRNNRESIKSLSDMAEAIIQNAST